MNYYYCAVLCFLGTLFAQTVPAQNLESPCGTDLMRAKALQDPAVFQQYEAFEQSVLAVFEQKKSKTGLPEQAKILPTVVHIIHDGGPENITDAQVQQAIAWINQALANQGPFNQGSGADCGIQLCLAQRTPDGQSTNGITRNQSPLTEMQLETQDLQVKNINRWNPKEYVNIWLVRSICSINYGCGVYGYSYYPFQHGTTIDGIAIEASYVTETGKITGLAHEIGHYLGLYHTFEGGCSNSNCLTQGDRICDTPPDQSTAGVPCGDNLSSCSTDTQSGPFSTDQPDMNWNFMDYGIIACFHDFTPDQSTRMNAALDGVRKSLLDSKGCLPPCPANTVASFTASATSVPMGELVNFSNTSQNAGSSEWLVNGVPFSNQVNASYTFPSPGTYTISLNVAPLNSALCDPDHAQLIIEVFCPVTAAYTVSNITPNEDETIYLNNTSQSSNQNEWFINGISQGGSLDSINFSTPGAYEIRLVTSNGVCGDTTTEFVYVLGVCLNKTFETNIQTIYSSATARSATILTDGSLLIAGLGTTPGVSTRKLFAKMKPDGTLVWLKHAGDSTTLGQSIVARATSDGGFVAMWAEGTLSGPMSNWYLAKYDANGVNIWSKKIEWSNQIINAVNADIVVNPDGSFVVCGAFLARFLGDGTPVWAKDIPDAVQVLRHPSGGFLVLNLTDLVYLNDLGNQVWRKELMNPANSFSPLGMTVLPNGEIYITGTDQVNPSTIWHGVLLKLNQNGNSLWSKKYRQSPVSTYQFEGITQTLAGNLMIAGYARAADPGPANFNDYHFMLELDLNGNILSSKHRPGKIMVSDLIPSPGGGYIMAGGEGFWVLKTNEKGETPGCQDAPHDLISFDFDVSSSNSVMGTTLLFLVPNPSNLDMENSFVTLDSICAPACLQSFEICNNNLDDDGDGLFDCLDPECDCTEDKCDPKQGDIWYFGFNAGLDFGADPPVLLNDGAGNCSGAAATMCDVQGRLLFYADGHSLFNRFHQPMPNGILQPTDSVLHTLIVPNPGNANQFYVFVSYYPSSTVYSLVDMSLDGSNGDVVATQKNVAFSPLSSGLAAVKACSFSGYWLVTRTLSASNFLAFRVDQNGLNPTPVSSPTGQSASAIQQLKFSPDGKRIASTHIAENSNTAVLSIFDFDPYLSGVVSNPLVLVESTHSNNIWGVEFAPNGRLLYATGAFAGNVKLVQYDLEAGNLAAIQASRVKLSTLPGQGYGFPQLTPHGKIYMTSSNTVTPPPYWLLSVVNQPNEPGLACQFTFQSIDISDFVPSGGARFGLNNAIASYFSTAQTPKLSLSSPDTICTLNSPIFYQIENVQCGVDSIIWKAENLDVQIQANYQYANIRYLSPGSGKLIVTAYTPCGKATDTLNILAVAPLNKTVNLGPDLVVCQNGVFTFNAGSGFAKYQWSDGTSDSTVTTLFPGTYWVNAWDLCGNLQSDTITVSIAPSSVLNLGPDLPQQCSGFSVNYQRPSNFASWSWSPADFLSCTDCPNVTASPTVSATWVVVGQTADGCISIDTLSATIRDTLLFSRDTFVCTGETLVLFGVQLPADTTAEFFFPAPGLGCDSLLTVHVLGLDNASSNLNVTICSNAFFNYNGWLLPADTLVVVHLSSVSVCDSVVTVKVNAFPALDLNLPQDTSIHIGASVLLEAEINGTGNLDLVWSPSDGLSCITCPDPLASPLDTITYSLAVTDGNGCTAQESVTIRVNEECRVRMPNAFTPNRDGANDIFRPVLDPCVRTLRLLKIKNRWGQTVFEQVNIPVGDPNMGWDGQFEGRPHPSDVLIWIAEFQYFDGRIESQNGELTLIR